MKSRRVFITLLVTLCLLLGGTGLASAETELSKVISVSGNGVVKMAPNVADVNFSVITEASDAGLAQAKNAEIVSKVINSLQNTGISSSDINTAGYYLYPRYVYDKGKPAKISGYEVRNEITVTVRDTALVGKVIDLAVDSGINQVQNIRFYVEDSTEQKARALRLAIQDARAKADVIAAALGKRITGIKSASGNWYDDTLQPIIFKERLAAEAAADNAVFTPLNPGLVEIKATAEIVYIIE